MFASHVETGFPGVSGSRHDSNRETHASKCAIGSARIVPTCFKIVSILATFSSTEVGILVITIDDAALRVLKQPNNLPFRGIAHTRLSYNV